FINFDFCSKEHLVRALRCAAESASVPVTFHLDHGAREMPFELLTECLSMGFPSVMYDGSHLPLQDNIRLMRRVVEAARPYKAAVEGELGQVSREPDASREEIVRMMTDPEQASRFVTETGIDSLAVSVGSVTGCFESRKIELDFDRLEAIARAVEVPLVFHGGTGIPDEQMRKAIEMGVAKVNVAHGLRKAFVDTLREGLGAEAEYVDPRPVLHEAVARMGRYVEGKLRLLGSTGKAGCLDVRGVPHPRR
ncbi:MAG: class II fructose-bisphosphate aldolase, partial [Armatimonadetes bacterium]|nr:class II fructose-bisphosphate aldolase [Armatimonadota bacterium]